MRKLTLLAGALIAALSLHPTRADPPSAKPPMDPVEGDFGRMFPTLPPFAPPDELLVALAAAMKDPNLPENDNPLGTPSGFTYLGQIIDHELTLMNRALAEASPDLGTVPNERTARFDLDFMYGGGRTGNPELYDDSGRFLFSSPNGFDDFQRTADGKAIVPEGRNDENLVIAQIHLALMHVHNHFMETSTFSEAQRLTRWHWQWVIVHSFMPEILGQDMVDSVITYNGAGKPRATTSYYRPRNPNRPMMPIEFASAAYRFGHSMVRLAYIMPTGSVTKTQVFNAAQNDLHGGRPIPLNLKIDFNNFFDLGVPAPPGRNISRKIDALISASLFVLPVGSVVPVDPPAVTSLPERNLLRGKRIGLPSYQAVARALGLVPYTNAELGLVDPGWGNEAPLWFGVLKESELATGGTRLGPTGGRIVAEVFAGLLDADRDSYFNAPQAWHPATEEFGIADLLRLAGAI